MAFSLLSAAVVRGLRWQLLWCAVWPVVDVAFEWCQSPLLRGKLADLEWTGRVPYLSGYLARGTFDWWDIGSAALGGVCAAGLVAIAASRRTRA
jgi:hypothetical protein